MAEIESKTSDVEELRKLIKNGRHERITHLLLATAILELADNARFGSMVQQKMTEFKPVLDYLKKQGD